MNVQKKLRNLFFVLIVVVVVPSFSPVSMQVSYTQVVAEEENGVAKIQLILKKLRASMASMKDFDDLEKAGMAKRDVDRLRRAMSQKIKQLTDDAIASIHSL